MANELTFEITGQYSPATEAVLGTGIESQVLSVTQNGARHGCFIQDVGITEEALTIPPDITNKGYIFVKNIDPTNYIQIGFSTGVYGIRLKAGEWALLRLEPTANVFVIANTTIAKLQTIIYED